MKTFLQHIEIHTKHHSGPRRYDVTRITPHCVVGQWTADQIGKFFRDTPREASCNYGIGKAGDLVECVPEENRSWCSSSADNDNRAITIEIASDTKDPYAMTDAAYNKFLDLAEDICRRYKKTRLVWIPDKSKALAYTPASGEMLLTVHRWFAAKACPGDWFYSRLGEAAAEVTRRLNLEAEPETVEHPSAWAAEATAWAQGLGITDGYRPHDPATREQVWTMLKRLYDAMK